MKNKEMPLGYNWIIQDIRAIAEGDGFLNVYMMHTGSDLKVYEDIPIYKYYYRFLRPIKYLHPSFKGCEDSFWEIFFHLVFAEGEDPKVINGKDGVPDLSFSFSGYGQLRTSRLSFREYKKITSDMAAQAFTNTGVNMLGINIDRGFALTLPNDTPPLKEEIIKMYGGENDDGDISSFIESVDRRIRNYDLQTFEYRLKNQNYG